MSDEFVKNNDISDVSLLAKVLQIPNLFHIYDNKNIHLISMICWTEKQWENSSSLN